MRLQDALAARLDAVPGKGADDAGLPFCEPHPALGSALPEDAKAIIHCPAPSVMSSGRRRAAEWVLEFEPHAPLFIEPLMGWAGSTDTLTQVRLRFPNREAAVAYAHRQGLRYEIREPTHVRRGDLAQVRNRFPELDHHLPVEVAWAWDAPHLALDRLRAANADMEVAA